MLRSPIAVDTGSFNPSVLEQEDDWEEFFRAIFSRLRWFQSLWQVSPSADLWRTTHALLNSILSNFGVKPIKWLGGPAQWTTFFALLTLCSWRWMGVNIIYYLSGLQSIPTDLYEAAHIDGAGSMQKLKYITIPLLRPVTIYILTISIYGGIAMFLESFMLFNGNRSPGGAGLTIVGYLYRLGWEQANIGYGSAIGLTLLVITLGVNVIMLKCRSVQEGRII